MNDKNIISNFKFANELNIEKIINEYSNYLFKIVRNICGNSLPIEDIEEIILDVFIAVWQNKSKLDSQKSIKPYLSSIAHNLTKKKLIETNKNLKITEIDENRDYSFDDWTTIIDSKLKTEELNHILNNLSVEEYQIFTKFYYYSKKTKEIAKELDISDVKVKTKLHRIRHKIKNKLNERGYRI